MGEIILTVYKCASSTCADCRVFSDCTKKNWPVNSEVELEAGRKI